MKTILVALVFLILGFAVSWGYNKYTVVMNENAQLRKQVNEIPAAPTDPTPTIAPDAEPEEQAPGTIEGTLGYPSEGIPPLEVYAFNAGDKSIYFKTKTTQNQGTYALEKVPPGTYVVVAYAGSNYAGGYSKAVPCGLSVICTDHSLIPVEVKTGETTKGVDLKDWYAPENTFPQKPQ